MSKSKPHLELHKLDLQSGWEAPPGFPSGIKQKVLASDFDEARKSRGRSRLVRFDPGVYTVDYLVHEYWEEVFVVSGDLTMGNDRNGNGGTSFGPGSYACRPPGTLHGPFKSNGGCILFELHYFAEPSAGQ